MRTARTLLAQLTTAAARQPERYLTAGNPTGLTGLLTHPCPRSTLIYLYQTTLKQLAGMPASSAYKAATANLTRHRLKIVEAAEPTGYAEWRGRARRVLDDNKAAFGADLFGFGEHAPEAAEARMFGQRGWDVDRGPYGRQDEWDGEVVADATEGLRSPESLAAADARIAADVGSRAHEGQGVEWDKCPPLEANQISDIEEKIGAGLIEEVIQVAEGELQLVFQMNEAKAWEELEDKVPEGQWGYFARDTHMAEDSTQKP